MSNRKTLDGRPSIFRRSSDATTGQPDGQALEQLDVQASDQSDSKAAKAPRIKATFYLEPGDIVAIDRMQTEEFTRTGKKPERSQLVSRAIQALALAGQRDDRAPEGSGG